MNDAFDQGAACGIFVMGVIITIFYLISSYSVPVPDWIKAVECRDGTLQILTENRDKEQNWSKTSIICEE
jgi:hypothetical protein